MRPQAATEIRAVRGGAHQLQQVWHERAKRRAACDDTFRLIRDFHEAYRTRLEPGYLESAEYKNALTDLRDRLGKPGTPERQHGEDILSEYDLIPKYERSTTFEWSRAR